MGTTFFLVFILSVFVLCTNSQMMESFLPNYHGTPSNLGYPAFPQNPGYPSIPQNYAPNYPSSSYPNAPNYPGSPNIPSYPNSPSNPNYQNSQSNPLNNPLFQSIQSQYPSYIGQYYPDNLPYVLTKSQVTAIEEVLINGLGLERASYGQFCNPCTQGDLIGALVRLVFHDSVGGNGPNGIGGPNGCIDLDNIPSKFFSAGLSVILAQLAPLYEYVIENIQPSLSRADFWVIAGNLAIRIASTVPPGTPPYSGSSYGGIPGSPPPPPAYPLVLPFRYGRKDDDVCNDSTPNLFFPSAGFSFAQMESLFVSRLGLSRPQFTALMGAHSCGRATPAASGGVNGGWTRWQSTFSNLYFTVLGGPYGGYTVKESTASGTGSTLGNPSSNSYSPAMYASASSSSVPPGTYELRNPDPKGPAGITPFLKRQIGTPSGSSYGPSNSLYAPSGSSYTPSGSFYGVPTPVVDPNDGLLWVLNTTLNYYNNHIPGLNDNIMLKVDVEILLNPVIPNCTEFWFGASPAPPPSNCPFNPYTADYVYLFATDMQLFYKVFTQAWQILTEFQYTADTLRDVVDDSY